MLLTTLLLAAPAIPQATPVRPPQTQKPAARFTPPTQNGVGCSQIGGSFCVPFDSTFDVVPFPATFNACNRNDDGSGQLFLSGWSFDFYGTAWSDVWVNNNGNVSFGVPFSTFSASGFPISSFPMIAPFWGDVDTRADSGADGAVWFREWSTANGDAVNRLVIVWDNVGYFNAESDKLNTFQLILTDGADPLLGAGNNVCFCYDDMQWTTGSASNGVNGFGGVPATVGANQGNGIDFFQIGRFDQPGGAYDGPGGNSDGVDYLDGQQICFSVGAGGTNVPPVFVGATVDYTVDVGSTLMFDVQAIGPETPEVVTLTNDASALANFSTMDTPGNPAVSSATFTPDVTQVGVQTITFTATDDGTPTASSDLVVQILVSPSGSIGSTLCSPNAANSTGLPAVLFAAGNEQASANDVSLFVGNLPPNAFGYFATSQSTGFLPMPGGSQGDFCINGPEVGRYDTAPISATVEGFASQGVDLTQIPHPVLGSVAALAGETHGWQLWYRDSNPGATSNWTNAVRVTFQ
ncbi:MAG: nidogen-like domain-containing protein [Planctomycetota bacterium]